MASWIACRPSAASATTSKAPASLKMAAMPWRTSVWSSAMSTLIRPIAGSTSGAFGARLPAGERFDGAEHLAETERPRDAGVDPFALLVAGVAEGDDRGVGQAGALAE